MHWGAIGLCHTGTVVLPQSPRSLARVILGTIACALLATTALAARTPPGLPDNLPPAERARLQEVTQAAAVTTYVEGEPFVGRREIFEFLLDHPEFATHVTRALRLARYRIWRDGAGLHLDDGWGVVGSFELVYTGGTTRIMYAKGRYEHRILPNINGEAVVVVAYDVRPAEAGRNSITTAVTGFVKLENRLLAMVGRVARTLASAKADKEAQRLVKTFARASRAVEENPGGVYEQIRQRPDVPARDLEDFRRLLNLR